jgi:hypothetical protein
VEASDGGKFELKSPATGEKFVEGIVFMHQRYAKQVLTQLEKSPRQQRMIQTPLLLLLKLHFHRGPSSLPQLEGLTSRSLPS